MLERRFLEALARKGRIDLVRTLRAYPQRCFTINELARTSGVPVMTSWRAVKDLKNLGLVKTRKVGNAISVEMTDERESLRTLRLIPDTDPQRVAARTYASRLGGQPWMTEARLFGSIGRGEHSPGEEVDIAVVFDDNLITEDDAKRAAAEAAAKVRQETNVTIVPLCVPLKDMSRRGGLGSELRDKEVVWSR